MTEIVTDDAAVPDYMQDYESYWKAIVEYPDGTLNKDQVARELADAVTLQRHLSEIYIEVSSGRVSKPFTLPSVVAEMFREALTEAADEAISDLVTETRGPYASVRLPGGFRVGHHI
jgi:hypothetical protein